MTIEPRRLYSWLAAVASGALLVLAFPNFEFGFLAWVALVPLLIVLMQPEQTLWRAFLLGWMTGFVFFFFSCNWISHSMIRYGGMNVVLAYAAAALFTAITGLFPALFAWATARLRKSFGLWALGCAPLLWVATEWLRAIVTGTTWNALGVSQVNFLSVAHFAQIGGVGLISGSLVAMSAALILLRHIYTPTAKRILVVFLFVMLVVMLAETRLSPTPASSSALAKVLVAGVQPNLPVDILTNPNEFARRNANGLETNLKLTRDAITQAPDQKTDLIVWAESPLVLHYEQDDVVRNKLHAIVRENNAHLLFSTMGRDGENVYNSVQTITPDGKALKRYDKMRLVPFGEYVPLRPVLGAFVPAMIGDFTPGSAAVVNSLKLATQLAVVQNDEETQGEVALERTTNFVKVGTFICYEAAYPNLVRQFVINGATLLINVSDDAWFGTSAGAQQHLNHARMRAIETNRDLVRVTNSGISAFIKNDGSVVEPLPMFTATSKVWAAEERQGLTWYVQHGDWFAILSVVLSSAVLVLSLVKKPLLIRDDS